MKEKLALSGSLLSVFLASVCCLGPILALTGIATSLGFASFLTEWRPYLLGFTFLLLGFAIYFTYRKPKLACQDGSCPPKGASRWNKGILWGAVVVVSAIAVFPYYAHSTTTSTDSCCVLKKDTNSSYSNQEAKKQTQSCEVSKGKNEAMADNLSSLEINKLKEEFNKSTQSVRVISILSPTCPACQCGQGMLKKVFSKYNSDNLKGFVAWTSMLTDDNANSAKDQAAIWHDQRIIQGWDAQHHIGELFANTLKLKGKAWDVYLLYAPGVKWEGNEPPKPSFWMHQLKEDAGADQKLCLNQDKFSDEVGQALTDLQTTRNSVSANKD